MIETKFFGEFENEEALKAYIVENFSGTNDVCVYVGTYAKYNGGSLDGDWLEIPAFGSYDEFMEACRCLHCDERDPEIMFQDYMYFPEELYCESGITEDMFDHIVAYAQMDIDTQAAYEAYLELFTDMDIDRFKENFIGQFDDAADFGYWLATENCLFDGANPVLEQYFDFEAYGRSIRNDECYTSGGYYFWAR